MAAVSIDTAQIRIPYDAEGKVVADRKDRSARPRRKENTDYNMRRVSGSTKSGLSKSPPWKGMIGETVNEVTGMKVKQQDENHTPYADILELGNLLSPSPLSPTWRPSSNPTKTPGKAPGIYWGSLILGAAPLFCYDIFNLIRARMAGQCTKLLPQCSRLCCADCGSIRNTQPKLKFQLYSDSILDAFDTVITLFAYTETEEEGFRSILNWPGPASGSSYHYYDIYNTYLA